MSKAAGVDMVTPGFPQCITAVQSSPPVFGIHQTPLYPLCISTRPTSRSLPTNDISQSTLNTKLVRNTSQPPDDQTSVLTLHWRNYQDQLGNNNLLRDPLNGFSSTKQNSTIQKSAEDERAGRTAKFLSVSN